METAFYIPKVCRVISWFSVGLLYIEHWNGSFVSSFIKKHSIFFFKNRLANQESMRLSGWFLWLAYCSTVGLVRREEHLAGTNLSQLLSLKCNFDKITLVSVRVCVCPPIGCRTITSAILYRFSPNFACRSEMWLFRTLLFLEQTGSSLPILEMCKIQFWQFRGCGGHIFLRIVIKTWTEI